MRLASATLEAALRRQFPIDTLSWATDEVRDMSRSAREILQLSELHAVPFDTLSTPSEWNTHGVLSIVRWYKQMDAVQQVQFCDLFEHWLNEWTEP